MRRDRLAAWLAEHEAIDAEERRHVQVVLDALAGEPDPFDRRTATPGHVTASAFVVAPDGRSVLLVLHEALGRWLQPGGHVEPGDADVVAAARREVLEETGIAELEVLRGAPRLLDVDVHEIPPRPSRGEPAHLHLDVRIALRARSEAVAAGDGVRDARWVPFDEVARVGADRSVLRAVERLRGGVGEPAPVDEVPDGPLDPRAEEVLRAWFGEARPPTAERQRAWWGHDPEVDDDVRRRFGGLHQEAMEGRLGAWAGSPRGRLALVIVLDQLSRHLHRGAPGMYAADPQAVALSLEAVAAGQAERLDLYERMFLLMPLMHAEDVRLQAVSVAAFRQLAADAARAGDVGFGENLAFAIRHRDIVVRFGRFPHRNAILGRASTPEELAFLLEPGSSF